MRSMVLVLVAASALVVVPAGQASRSAGLISANGRVGKVYVDRATTRDVLRAYGTPKSTRRETTADTGTPLTTTMWSYTCKGSSGASRFFFGPDGILRNFFSSCRTWVTPAGTHVGDRRDDAEAREGRRAHGTCGDGVVITKREMFITFFREGPGARVRAMGVASRRRSVLGC